MSKFRWSAEELERRQKLTHAMEVSFQRSQEAFRQKEEAISELDPREQIKLRAQYVIEEARLNYDQALHQLRRMEDDKRNDRLDAIAASSKVATWVAVLVGLASLAVSLLAILKA